MTTPSMDLHALTVLFISFGKLERRISQDIKKQAEENITKQ
jgi:hypothetical protein